MTLDLEEVRQIIETGPRGYYDKQAIACERRGVFVPSIDEVLRRVCQRESRVLDVGCGNAATLVRNAGVFGEGVGIDNYADMLALAREHVRTSGVKNVQIIEARADHLRLRFPHESFDVVFSERGPIPHADINTYNAVSLLRRGGTLFLENPAPLANRELATLFGTGPVAVHPAVEHGVLDSRAAECVRMGIDVQFTCSIVEDMVYADFASWLRAHMSAWDYYPDWRFATWPIPEGLRHGIERFLSLVMDEAGHIHITNHRTWVIGVKR